VDEPTTLEKVALGDMRPAQLKKLPDEEISEAWLRLNQWFANATKRKQPTEDIINAAVWVSQEMKRRGFEISPSALVDAIEDFRKTKTGWALHKRMNELPRDVVLVRDFVSVVGSLAKGHPDPKDMDVMLRAVWDKDSGQVVIQSENVWLPIRNTLDPDKKGKLHWLSNPQGAHGDFIPLYDLVLRRREDIATQFVKAEDVRIDIGCGDCKPAGYIGVDKRGGEGVDLVHDLDGGLPFSDDYADEVRANHVLEHLADKSKVMAEIHRVLKPGGRFVFEIPSTDGPGAFAHPEHKSFWNKASFAFWTQADLAENRPMFEVEHLVERKKGNLIYVCGALRKPSTVEKALQPFQRFTPPKPAVEGFTELYDVDDVWAWAEDRLPIDVEPKLNGFRTILLKKGDEVGAWFEGQIGKNLIDRFPDLAAALKKMGGDFVLDADIAIEKEGKRLPRNMMAKLNSDDPKLDAGEKIVVTVFDAPFLDEDLSDLPFKDRREILESKVKGKLPITQARWVNSLPALKAAAKWAFGFDASEGLVAKTSTGKYETGGTTNEWSKLKRVAELKVAVLDAQKTKTGDYNYWCGLLPGDLEFANTRSLNGTEYIDLGKTFNTNIEAKPGEVLTVQVLELIPDEAGKRLMWLGPRVIDVDRTRKAPYFAAQAIDVARRAAVLQKALDIVPTFGPEGAPIMFVGASPSRTEAVRGEPFVGAGSELFVEMYLKPLGLSRADVAMTNAVPRFLTDEKGKVREPTNAEAEEWKPWLHDELDRMKPKVVVALGQTAKRMLGERAGFVLPHPSAVRRFGDSGEVGRKTGRILDAIRKTEGEEETRGDRAQRLWEENWHEYMPTKQGGRFVYQHHWRGLDEKQKGMTDEALMDTTDHSVHGDIRLEGPDGLFGWAVFLGETKDNRGLTHKDKLIDLKADQNLRLAPKLQQPKDWLKMGEGKGEAVEPGGPGSTSQTYSKFFVRDEGTYQLGVATQHAVEIFLDGKYLSGRYMLTLPRLGAERVWLIDKPTDQKPRAEAQELADVISEQRRKGRDFVVWAKPGEKPVKYDVRSGKVAEARKHVAISKADQTKRIVYGVVVDPYGPNGPRADAHNDWIPPAAVEETAHAFLKGQMVIGFQHKAKADAKVVESWVEQYPSRAEYLKAMRGENHSVYRRKFGSDVLHSGSWVLGVQLGDDEWKAYQDGDVNAFSPGGVGFRAPMSEGMMPKVTFLDLVPAEGEAK
jgi:uracil-DNA glycosylase family 4